MEIPETEIIVTKDGTEILRKSASFGTKGRVFDALSVRRRHMAIAEQHV